MRTGKNQHPNNIMALGLLVLAGTGTSLAANPALTAGTTTSVAALSATSTALIAGAATSGSAAIVTGSTLATASSLAAPKKSLDTAAELYRPELTASVNQCLSDAKLMRARIVAKDLDGARKAWVRSRIGWERAEVFMSGFTSELDSEIDAWPSAIMGYHFIEARLFGAGQMDDVMPATDALIFHLSDLQIKIRDTVLTGQGMLEGTAKLAYEIGESKADGGESRFSGTSLDDMRNNADGIETAYRLVFASELTAKDPALANTLNARIKQLRTHLQVGDLSKVDPDQVRTASEDVVLSLQKAAPVLGLDKPSLSDLAQQ